MKLPTALAITTLNGCRGLYGLIGAMALASVWGAAPGCAELEKEALPSVQTQGGHRLGIGQSLSIVATTENGSDSGYTFASSSGDIASVGADGVVRGAAVGEANITVTGLDTGATARHPIVVVRGDEIAGPDAGLPQGPPGSSYYEAWSSSGHADSTAEAFVHWNKDGAVPESCAKCHSRGGFIDFLGGDGTAAGRVDVPAALGTTVDCDACHHPAANALDSATFPSGVQQTGLGGEARCMTCHQGRSSGASLRQDIEAAKLSGDDTPSSALSFENIHYFPAASTLLAGAVQGGFQYEGQVYDTRFRHVESFDTCIECHDPHTTRPRFGRCAECHQGATDLSGARNIRMVSSFGRGYDGDGDVSEGIYYELQGSRERLLRAIVRYGSERASRLCYNEARALHATGFSTATEEAH